MAAPERHMTAAAAPATLPDAPKSMAALRFEEYMLPELLDMFKDMHEESPVLQQFPFEEKMVERVIATAIMNQEVVCGFACIDFTSGTIVGMLVCTMSTLCVSPEPIARDVLLYMRPAYRNEFVAKHLLDAFAGWAKRLGAAALFFTDITGLNDKLGKSMKATGWKQIGSAMMRAIEQAKPKETK